MSDVNIVLQEREKQHGSFNEHARITQALKEAMHDSRNWDRLSFEQKESLEMVQHKIGRILAGDPDLIDHWVDAQGYLKLAQNSLEKHIPTRG